MPLPHPQGRRLTATPSLRAQRIATTALFALDGLVFGSWAVLPLMVNPFGSWPPSPRASRSRRRW